MTPLIRNFYTAIAIFLLPLEANAEPDLQIHYINVGQGGSTLIIGPNGTTILYDFGRTSGKTHIVGYLRKADVLPEDGIDYTFVSHRDSDHYKGYRGVIESGYDIMIANYGSGSPKTSPTIKRAWLTPAENTTAGPVRPIPIGLRINLGKDAEAIVVAANGNVLGDDRRVRDEKHKSGTKWNENDRSVSILIKFGKFEYLLDGDLGSGREACSGHKLNTQKNVQVPVALALLSRNLIPKTGIDVLHIAHHGAETSTSAEYLNLVKPRVGLTSVGWKGNTFDHPRVSVFENVLVGPNRKDKPSDDCVTAPALEALFQTEDGPNFKKSNSRTSKRGIVIGDIKLVTDGETHFTISGTNRVIEGSRKQAPASPVVFSLN